MKIQTSHRIDEEIKALLARLAAQMHLSETAVLILAIQEKAKKEGVK